MMEDVGQAVLWAFCLSYLLPASGLFQAGCCCACTDEIQTRGRRGRANLLPLAFASIAATAAP